MTVKSKLNNHERRIRRLANKKSNGGTGTGPTGDTGATGATGEGVPAGGTTGQVLEKIDGTDYNTQWATPAVTDYQEGTWTVVLSDAATGGNVASYSGRKGSYTRVGNMVTVWGEMGNINTTGMTAGNILYIQGLPFTPSEDGHGTVRVNLFTLANTGCVLIEATEAVDYLILKELKTNTNAYTMLVSDVFSASADIFFTITYEAD